MSGGGGEGSFDFIVLVIFGCLQPLTERKRCMSDVSEVRIDAELDLSPVQLRAKHSGAPCPPPGMPADPSSSARKYPSREK